MSSFFKRSNTSEKIGPNVLRLVETGHFELIPEASTVSVTCSPNKNIQATLDMAAELLDLGHIVIPHLAARMIENTEHVETISNWLTTHNVNKVFVIGGDAAESDGPTKDAGALIEALLNANTPLTTIGFGGYPDGHSTIPETQLSEALLAKQQLLDSAGVGGWISTQMCFDTKAITRWVAACGNQGVHLPIHLGIPGVIDTTKLLTMGAKLGVGTSLRYLRKNMGVVSKLATLGGYDPMTLLAPLENDFVRLNIVALHIFTFNQVANTTAWQQAVIQQGQSTI